MSPTSSDAASLSPDTRQDIAIQVLSRSERQCCKKAASFAI
ncbi:MAG: hypothetical protein AAFW84_35850 [Cyanobacteria bacterium J06635_15]